MSNSRNALITLADYALRAAKTAPEELAIYDALAIVGSGDEFGALAASTARMLRIADRTRGDAQATQVEFRAILRALPEATKEA